jgi:transcriptional regulator GlxA family with amidase domain
VVELLEQSFWTALINALPEFKANENLTVAGRAIPGYLRKTIHFINENCSEDLNLNDLASVAGKSVRSLQSGFQKTYGYGPTAYLRKVKLLRVREHILQRPGEDLQVIAARFGFYHAGNFARYYRQEFGELPSETSKSSIKIN